MDRSIHEQEAGPLDMPTAVRCHSYLARRKNASAGSRGCSTMTFIQKIAEFFGVPAQNVAEVLDPRGAVGVDVRNGDFISISPISRHTTDCLQCSKIAHHVGYKSQQKIFNCPFCGALFEGGSNV